MKTKTTAVSRRSFIAGISAATAATALPVPALGTPRTRRWTDAAATDAAVRTAYLAALARFARELEPRFRSGELRAFRSPDDEKTDTDAAPMGKLEALVGEAFGVSTKVIGGSFEGDAATAFLLLAASPHAEIIACSDLTFNHPTQMAQEAIAWDTIIYARREGWYVPSRHEQEDPLICVPCDECGCSLSFHDEDGCHVLDCGCTVAHTPHVPGVVA